MVRRHIFRFRYAGDDRSGPLPDHRAVDARVRETLRLGHRRGPRPGAERFRRDRESADLEKPLDMDQVRDVLAQVMTRTVPKTGS